MCGIFFIYGSPDHQKCIEQAMQIQPRGPDHTSMVFDNDAFMCFQRLKVNDLTDAGNQPMYHDETYLLCNGEIYNCKYLNQKYKLNCMSSSDCETVLRLYLRLKDIYGFNTALKHLVSLLDGEFAFVLYDKNEKAVIACRDPIGVRPLFHYKTDSQIGFSSELKGLHKLSQEARQFPPGTFEVFSTDDMKTLHCYNYAPLPIEYLPQSDEQEALHKVKETFTNAVVKRLMSDRPVCALLSGGLDSSLVASIVARHIAPQKLNTFCIGIEGSTDLHYAKLVAKHINSNHHIVELKEEEFLSAIDETIRIIESYDITSVRASVGNLLVSKYIANNTDCKVVYNGDYSDEVCGGYMYLKKAPSDEEFHNECSRLVKEITYFDSLRSDRTISSQGLEARVPFSDTEFVHTYMSINPSLRVSHSRIEKYLLRKAFSEDNLLPTEVLWRYKEAFSDGVSKPERSWHHVIKEYIDKVITDEEFQQESGKFLVNTPPSKEAYYYRKVFESFYPNMGHVIPQFWLPRWSDNIQDPSARELEVYTC